MKYSSYLLKKKKTRINLAYNILNNKVKIIKNKIKLIPKLYIVFLNLFITCLSLLGNLNCLYSFQSSLISNFIVCPSYLLLLALLY